MNRRRKEIWSGHPEVSGGRDVTAALRNLRAQEAKLGGGERGAGGEPVRRAALGPLALSPADATWLLLAPLDRREVLWRRRPG